ncbi:MAG: hypothetical protein B7O98_01785 [Zestosphaera tikiterensis]|uniref:Pyruvate/ketoisovalerate oxidoreductase catalytic domain-containing protein n=1 Tax=Zestosphaera tikiterensis TaxID=1973259 RepID=A0A2R7Y6M5_9CREN|nr:MAG: hypothetical protein B7O98_01785 [Zestosphaera tikiterensis]
MLINILVSGVGGQGLLTLARLLGQAAIKEGMKAYVAETHGLSQRGGSVVVHVRIGNDELSAPLIPEGEVDIHVSLELIEAVRNISMQQKDSILISNDKIIRPSIPKIVLPSRDDLIRVANAVKHFYLVNASEESLNLGNPYGANIVLLGFTTYILSEGNIISKDSVRQEVANIGRGKVREVNLKLFDVGYEKASKNVRPDTVEYIRKKKA